MEETLAMLATLATLPSITRQNRAPERSALFRKARQPDSSDKTAAQMTKRTSPPVRRVKGGSCPEASLYDRIGGEKIERLVAVFYARVDSDPVIRRFYGKTLTCAIHALTNFMITWLGGPPVYDLRGARLR